MLIALLNLTMSVKATRMGILNACCKGWKCKGRNLQRESCQPVQHNARKILGLLFCPFGVEYMEWPSLWDREDAKNTLTGEKARGWTATLASPVISSSCSFLEKSLGFSLLYSPKREILISIALTETTSSLHSPSCILVMLVWCSLEERGSLVREPWE